MKNHTKYTESRAINTFKGELQSLLVTAGENGVPSNVIEEELNKVLKNLPEYFQNKLEIEKLVDKFLSDYNGIALLKKHTVSEHGVWQIYGADSNCDLGGSHYVPLLDTVSGVLSDVIRNAVVRKKFWSWGSGEIRSVSIKKV